MGTKILKLCFIVSLLLLAGNAMAELTIEEGKPTGQWYNPDRDGEGFYVEVIDTAGAPQLGLAMYSFDATGNQLWFVGNAPVEAGATAITVPVFQVDGPVWGSGFDPADKNTTEFGTVTVRFTSCNSALFQVRAIVDLEDLDTPAVRLTNVVGIECVDEPPQPVGVTPGIWEGEEGVCLNVAADGKSLTTVGSTCPNEASIWLDIAGIKADIGGGIDPSPCVVDASCLTDVTISPETGFFQCVTERGLAEGYFNSATNAYGNGVQTILGEVGSACLATWTAAPKP